MHDRPPIIGYIFWFLATIFLGMIFKFLILRQ